MHATVLPLQEIACPTLLITGSEDVLAVNPKRLVDAIPGAVNAVVSGDHLGALRETSFVEALLGFLDSQPR
jgi:pimeloyl-ACP methyl ester carboxylesterase